MKSATLVTLNMRELDRLKMIQSVVDMGLKPARAAERLGLTVRQVERLVARYRESGAAGLARGTKFRTFWAQKPGKWCVAAS
ncbi:helix-turn-helix domain-containing protein [Paraburkholderia sp. XV]|uniref:helix-turn-helix domain-containing protein n=1 Tax=Paraburkholderia sp. XV TaxID=2831520 RepID=UPI003990AB38